MSASSWARIRPGDTATIRNRFIAVSRSVTVMSLLPAPALGFIDDDGQTFTHDGYEIAIGTPPPWKTPLEISFERLPTPAVCAERHD